MDKIITQVLPDHTVNLIIEQGVDLSNIAAALKQKDPAGSLFSVVQTRRSPRAVKRLAHKNNSENILVSYPLQIDEDRFSLEMLLDQSCEFFLDHMTGCHIQGMALVEAARQSFLAVTQEFYLRDTTEPYYFVIKSINSRFLSFAFPLRTAIDYRVLSYRPKEGRHAFDIAIQILQADEICAEFDISFTAFLAAAIAEREAEKAGQAVIRALSAGQREHAAAHRAPTPAPAAAE
ncbi:hypothetical protein AJ87_14840 [Rhizobium yanglingense]|nr:hypothetical protein AJ87_14840 [Rhizobium yanglingense]